MILYARGIAESRTKVTSEYWIQETSVFHKYTILFLDLTAAFLVEGPLIFDYRTEALFQMVGGG
jgi:hypothetical protein